MDPREGEIPWGFSALRSMAYELSGHTPRVYPYITDEDLYHYI